MGNYNIRLGCQLSFDEQQEADIIKAIEKLNATHKAGQFMSNIVRLAFDCPDIMDKSSGAYEKGAVIKALDEAGIFYSRKNFFDSLTKEVNLMKQKVDKMYEMVLKTYILGQMGKKLGLEEKADNLLMAQFVVEKQLKEIQDLLGITLGSSVLASNKKQEVEKIADNALEYIIESYSGIMNELKNIQPVIVQNVVGGEQNVQGIASGQNIESIAETTEQTDNKTEQKETEVEAVNTNGESSADEDETIDFGNADFSALSNFFGD